MPAHFHLDRRCLRCGRGENRTRKLNARQDRNSKIILLPCHRLHERLLDPLAARDFDAVRILVFVMVAFNGLHQMRDRQFRSEFLAVPDIRLRHFVGIESAADAGSFFREFRCHIFFQFVKVDSFNAINLAGL